MAFDPRQSYSIEAEDLILKRLVDVLGLAPSGAPGFYVDIGAYHPIRHSNTYLFYQLGWRGVNVEPNPDAIEDFRSLRPLDTTLNCGISDTSKTLVNQRFNDPLVHGFFDLNHDHLLVRSGYVHLGSTTVDCLGVRELLKNYIHQQIDILNIDIETHESVVLGAWNWEAYRPKLICVEIHTLTMTNVLETETASLLGANGYGLMSRVFQSAMFVDLRLLKP